MSHSLQVLYPITESTNFDYDCYFGKHMAIVGENIGEYMESSVVIKGIAGGPDVPAPYYAIATLVFKDKPALDGALSKIEKPVADVANFTNTKPIMLIGEVVS